MSAGKRKRDETDNKMEEIKDEIESQMSEVKRKQDEIGKKVDEIKDEMKSQMSDVKRKQDEIDNKVNETKDNALEMKQQFQHFTEILTRVADRPFFDFLSNNQEIMIMGGRNTVGETKRSVSIFNSANGTYAELPPMNYPRQAAASCVYNNDVIITGGFDGSECLDTIEIFKINQKLPRWTISRGRLPSRLFHHALIVYQDKLLVIGGTNHDTGEISDEINELALAWPYTPTLLARMPQPRKDHRAEIVNGKLFILGGKTTVDDPDVTDSVTMYDFIKNEFVTCATLPKPVRNMSTVTWRNTIIVIGGVDQKGRDLNDVIMYDIETERSERLPLLRHKRCGHSAVMIDDVIVVLGGGNDERGYLNSVESFTMDGDGWKELPGMTEEKIAATAVVLPRN